MFSSEGRVSQSETQGVDVVLNFSSLDLVVGLKVGGGVWINIEMDGHHTSLTFLEGSSFTTMGFILISKASILILCCSSMSSLSCLHSCNKQEFLSLSCEERFSPSPGPQSSLSPSYSCSPSSRSAGTCSGCFSAAASALRSSEKTSSLLAAASGTSTSSTPAGSEGRRLKWRFQC